MIKNNGICQNRCLCQETGRGCDIVSFYLARTDVCVLEMEPRYKVVYHQNAHTVKFRQGARGANSIFFNAAPLISQDLVTFFVMKLVKCVTRERICCGVLVGVPRDVEYV